jgi:hypothetical protein
VDFSKKNVYLDREKPYVCIQNVLGKKGTLKPSTKTKRVKNLPIIPEIEGALKANPTSALW